MLTFFSYPKPFTGLVSKLQRNAVRSWRMLDPKVEILLLGDEAGVDEMAQEVRAVRIPEVARTEWGAPRVDEIFRTSDNAARNELLCYINTDIILLPGFLDAVRRVKDLKKPFLVIGQRWDLALESEINYLDLRWEDGLRELLRTSGQMHSPAAIDYFIFRKGLWPSIPPFGLGRTVWDNWLVLEARRRGAAVVDATNSIWAVHQTHDYNHHPQGIPGVWFGPEAKYNMDLAGRPEYIFTLEDATHILGKNGIRYDVRPEKIKRHFSTMMVLWPVTAPVVKGVRRAYKIFQGLIGSAFRRKSNADRP
jgi:hypothetical protein